MACAESAHSEQEIMCTSGQVLAVQGSQGKRLSRQLAAAHSCQERAARAVACLHVHASPFGCCMNFVAEHVRHVALAQLSARPKTMLTRYA
jgi:hypothetical protein